MRRHGKSRCMRWIFVYIGDAAKTNMATSLLIDGAKMHGRRLVCTVPAGPPAIQMNPQAICRGTLWAQILIRGRSTRRFQAVIHLYRVGCRWQRREVAERIESYALSASQHPYVSPVIRASLYALPAGFSQTETMIGKILQAQFGH